MRILELRFKNLNSLQGEWHIDFTDPEYINNGIFALTGPTGAGKSTILDAICLALYGETPRLGKITKGENEIMSRHTGECYAEVVFQAQSGKYRCHWEQRRARKASDGNLQDQEHQIADAMTGKLLESKKSRVTSVIEEKTGMDFKRFNRSILLAQGSFDSFLKADSSHKSEILEQITGTEIYSEISKQVHERRRQEDTALNELQAEIRGIQLLTEEEIAEIQHNVTLKKLANTELKVHLDQTKIAVEWFKNIEQLKAQITAFAIEKTALTNEITAFLPKKNQLLLANKAVQLEGEYANLSAIRTQLIQHEKDHVVQTAQLPMTKQSLQKANDDLTVVVAKHQLLKTKHKEQQPIWQQVRNLDYALQVKKKDVSHISKQCDEVQNVLSEYRQKLITQQAEHTEQQELLHNIEHYLTTHKTDEWLVKHFFEMKEQLAQLKMQAENVEQQKNIKLKSRQYLTEMQQKLEKQQLAIAEALKEQTALQTELKVIQDAQDILLGGRTLPDYRREKDGLMREQLLLNRIFSLEEERKKLKDDDACPLCGSLDHPFAKGQLPEQDIVDIQIKNLDERIEKLETQEQLLMAFEKKLSDKIMQNSLMSSEITQITDKIVELTENQQNNLENVIKAEQKYQDLNANIREALQPLNVDESLNHEELLQHLQKRLDDWQNKRKQAEQIHTLIIGINGEIQQLSVHLSNKKAELSAKQKDLIGQQDALKTMQQSRNQLFGEKLVDAEEAKLTAEITTFELKEKELKELQISAQQQVALVKQSIEQLNVVIEEERVRLITLENGFISSLKLQKFEDESAFLSAKMGNSEREQLQTLEKSLEQRNIDLSAREQDRKAQLEREIAKELSTETLPVLTDKLLIEEAKWLQANESIAQEEFKIAENAKALERIAEKKSAIDQQRLELQRWDKLHGLIGSADGKKYRNFAQGLTFELMINHANRQLEKMTDRYLLMRDKDEPLKLNVIDNYQAGEERSTKNLSGGESFIISLALALGLSKMASRKVRVDSLFLDEGFGTLDEEALDTALSVLSNLHGEGKLIGVISHVSALKERIQTQIRIQPMSGGRSEIIGPGCGRVV